MSENALGETIKDHILRTFHIHQSSIIDETAQRFFVARSEVEQYVNQLVEEGKLAEMGNSTSLVGKARFFENPITVRDEEDEVYKQRIEPIISTLPSNVQRICYYGFTEMYNNAVDHSEGSAVTVHLALYEHSLEFLISDDGVGIFEKIKRAFGLEHHHEVFAALAKGGLTTDPERHSGQGIFFTSRAFDKFWIISKGASFSHDRAEDDWLLENDADFKGTLVLMSISNTSELVLRNLFDNFTVDKDELTVFNTHAPLRLSSLARGDFVSRSQAKRILARFDKYKEVSLDFAGIDFIGQAFADEIFRVFPASMPDINLVYSNANASVRSMIEFAKSTIPSGPHDSRTAAG